ncbi:MAG: DUF268 domain-containing protein [Ignavibacteriaceae bacterium]
MKKNKFFLSAYYFSLSTKDYFNLNLIGFIKSLAWYLSDYFHFEKGSKSYNDQFKIYCMYPRLNDKTKFTPLEPIYFFQDAWAAKKIFDLKPKHHYDVGSSAKTISIISQFVPTTMVDIRPLGLKLENLFFMEGSVLNLPFEDNSIESISSLCVIEHIGLGRYGDEIDILGSKKAIRELIRVSAHNGMILFSVPVDEENKVFFNAHRAFTREYIITQFNCCELIEEKYIYGDSLFDMYCPEKGFGTGLFLFKNKKENIS